MAKRTRLLFLAISLLASACFDRAPPGATATRPPIASTLPALTSTAVPPMDLTPPQLAALDRLARALGVPLSQIQIVSTEAVDWPDACLGAVEPDPQCAQVVTPGYRVVLEADGTRYEVHTNEDGKAVVEAVTLMWRRDGGIAGFCDELRLTLSGEATAASCRSSRIPPTARLEPGELAQLKDWARTFASAAAQWTDPAVADALTVGLTFRGYGGPPPPEADLQAMAEWAQAIYDRLARR